MILERELLENKTSIILQDSNLTVDPNDFESRKKIDILQPNLKEIFKVLKNNLNDIVIISNKKWTNEIYEQALESDTIINFIPSSQLQRNKVDLNLVENKNVIFYKCFSGMTSENNKTYKNILRIIEQSNKFIGIEVIGEKYLYQGYFNPLLKLKGVNIDTLEIVCYGKEELNNLLLESMIIVKNDEIIKNKKELYVDYWSDDIPLFFSNQISKLDGFSINTEKDEKEIIIEKPIEVVSNINRILSQIKKK